VPFLEFQEAEGPDIAAFDCSLEKFLSTWRLQLALHLFHGETLTSYLSSLPLIAGFSFCMSGEVTVHFGRHVRLDDIFYIVGSLSLLLFTVPPNDPLPALVCGSLRI